MTGQQIDDPQATEVPIVAEDDIVTARRAGRDMAAAMGFGAVDCVQIATAISELARNIFLYGGRGAIKIGPKARPTGPPGIEIIAHDTGPGIADLTLVMRDGYSSGGGLGLGLPGTKRLMDEFALQSRSGEGTTVTVGKWPRESR